MGYSFSQNERWAVFSVHGQTCYYGGHPIDLLSMEVDHLVPESLLQNPTGLAEVLASLGLAPNFNLNDYPNWLPICGPCNRKKSTLVFRATPLIQQQLGRAADHADRCRMVAARVVSDRVLGNAIGVISRAAGDGLKLDKTQITAIIEALCEADPEFVARLMTARLSREDYSNRLSRAMPPMGFQQVDAMVRLTPSASLQFVGGLVSLVQ